MNYSPLQADTAGDTDIRHSARTWSDGRHGCSDRSYPHVQSDLCRTRR